MDPPQQAVYDREQDPVAFSYFTHFEEYQNLSTRFLEIVEDQEQNEAAYNAYRRMAMIVRSCHFTWYTVSSLLVPA